MIPKNCPFSLDIFRRLKGHMGSREVKYLFPLSSYAKNLKMLTRSQPFQNRVWMWSYACMMVKPAESVDRGAGRL